MFVRQDLTPMPELLSKHRLESQDNKEKNIVRNTMKIALSLQKAN